MRTNNLNMKKEYIKLSINNLSELLFQDNSINQKNSFPIIVMIKRTKKVLTKPNGLFYYFYIS